MCPALEDESAKRLKRQRVISMAAYRQNETWVYQHTKTQHYGKLNIIREGIRKM